MTRAVLDACVLYSAAMRDLFMRLTVSLAFQPIWTDTIQDEWTRNVLANRPELDRKQIERTRALMERYGRDWQAPHYERYIERVELPDENDRHVVAAAIAGGASIIVTYNLKDFPDAALAAHGIRAQHPDTFLSDLLQQEPDAFSEAIRALLEALKNPPKTFEQLLYLMRAQGLHETARRLAAKQ